MKKLQANEKVIETPFGKVIVKLTDEDCCEISFGQFNKDYIKKYHCSAEGFPLTGVIYLTNEVKPYIEYYFYSDHPTYLSLPNNVQRKITKWCKENRSKLITPELMRGKVAEDLAYEVWRLKEKIREYSHWINECKGELIEKQRTLAVLRRKNPLTTGKSVV